MEGACGMLSKGHRDLELLYVIRNFSSFGMAGEEYEDVCRVMRLNM